tara:strand:+ start:509 stop:1855 length:1347 start_codon:yes stop_codon:yes gene_type:complete
MPTVSPSYMQKGVPNPYYTMDEPTVTSTAAALKREGFKVKNSKELLFKCVDKIKGKSLLDSRGQFMFQLAVDKKSILPFGIKTTKKQVKGHLGMATRKDSTASSNVNEFLTVYFLKNKAMTPKELEDHSCKMGNKSTGILTGEGTAVSFEDLCMLIDKDETAERDIKIGLNNARAVKKDIKKKVGKLYWVPRGKPQGVSPKTPSDVIIQFADGTFQGYSNKIAAGSDETPKFNTNIYAFYGKLQNSNQQNAIGKMIDNSWNQAAKLVKGSNSKKAIKAFDIKKEPFSESASKDKFAELASKFKADGSDFYADGFYYLFRNNLIKNFAKYLKDSRNLVYFLNTIYFYTYDDPRASFKPCPYKLLIGRESGESTIKDVSKDTGLETLLFNTKVNKLTQINPTYDGSSQRFVLKFKFEGKNIEIPITCRTRQAGGWSGKSLYINTPGVKFV